jgi:hypothetical protein
MINLFRQNQRIIMLVVAILTIIAFVWLYNPTTTHTNELGANFVAKIYGEKLTQADLEREARNYALAFRMQDIPLITGLTGGAGDDQQAVEGFVWNSMVLRHEAKALGIEPTQEQLTEATMKMSVFQTDDKFDNTKFNKFVSDQLPSLGFSPSQIDEIVRDSVRLTRVRDLVSAPATVSDSEVREVARIFEKLDFDVVKFDTKGIAETIEIKPEEVTEFFNRVKSNLFTPEKRAVEYVEFPLPKYEGATPQTDADKLAAQQKTADLADEFARKAEAGGSFADLAKAAGLEIKTVQEFERNQAPNGSPESSIVTAIAPATFALTEQKPVSDVIDAGGDKFVVVRLAKTTPSRPMEIEEVKPRIEAQIRSTKAAQKIAETANATLAKVREAIKSGQTFEQAVQAQGLTSEKFTGIVPSELNMQSPAAPYVRLTIPMEASQLSGFSPSADGGFAVYLENRVPLTDAQFAEHSKTVREQVLEQKRQLLFESWLQTARDDAGISAGNQAAE